MLNRCVPRRSASSQRDRSASALRETVRSEGSCRDERCHRLRMRHAVHGGFPGRKNGVDVPRSGGRGEAAADAGSVERATPPPAPPERAPVWDAGSQDRFRSQRPLPTARKAPRKEGSKIGIGAAGSTTCFPSRRSQKSRLPSDSISKDGCRARLFENLPEKSGAPLNVVGQMLNMEACSRIMVFTMSPMETMPASLSPLKTGRCRMRRLVMSYGSDRGCFPDPRTRASSA